jgi:uncharacterized membrane protein YphA (DoxX/SURF4 family)
MRLPGAMRLKFAGVAFEYRYCEMFGELMQRSDLARWAVLPMRLVVGYGFIEHGFAKLSKGPDTFTGILQQLDVPLPCSHMGDNRHGAFWGDWLCCWEPLWPGRAFRWLWSCSSRWSLSICSTDLVQ